MTRNVADAATLLDAMVGYDSIDPVTALSVGNIPKTYTASSRMDGRGLA
jgi:amidase